MPPLPKTCTRCGGHFEAVAAFCPRDGAPLTTDDDEPDPYLGTVLFDQFRIEEKIGAGGMGTVYRARQTTIDRDVAIKILHRELTQNPDAVRRFHREAKVSSTLDHPNIARTFLFGQLADGSLYIVMEYLSGKSLLDLVRTEGALSVARALKIATQICDGVGEAHAQGIVHRDVKPENLLLVTRGKDPEFVKVLDFGIARFLWGETTIVTQSGLIFGTARYISPEGAQGETTDARSDVYSIGVLTYQLLVGETPFDSPSPVALLMKHIHEPAPDIRTRGKGATIPQAVADVVMRALAKNPEVRPSDAQELGAALRAAAAASGVGLAPPRIAGTPSITPPEPARPPVAAPNLAWHATGRTLDGRSELGTRPGASVAVGTGTAGAGAAGGAATPVLPVARGGDGWTSETLANAPSPYGEDVNESVRLPGMLGAQRPRLSSAVLTMVIAFVLGAGAVGGGAWIASRLLRSDSASGEDLAALEASAQRALDRGAYDSPAGDNVAEITARMLRIDPSHHGATALRQAAAERLCDVGDSAAAQGYVDEARAAYQRALAILPGDPEVSEHFAAFNQAPQAPTAPTTAPAERSIRTDPEPPVAGRPTTLVAVIAAGTTLANAARPHFHVTRAGRAVRGAIEATRAADGRYVATFTFPHDGEYAVRFLARAEAGHTVDLQGLVQVGAVAGAPRVAGAPPAVTERPTQAESPRSPSTSHPRGGERIDWTIPPMFGPVVTPSPGTTVPDPLPPPQVDPTPPPQNVSPPPPVDPTPPPPPNNPPPDDTPPPPPPPWNGTLM